MDRFQRGNQWVFGNGGKRRGNQLMVFFFSFLVPCSLKNKSKALIYICSDENVSVFSKVSLCTK